LTVLAVFDCMVILQAAARPTGPAGACFGAVREGRVTLLLSPEILTEVRDVLSRPKVLRKFPALTQEAIDVFLRELADRAVTILDVPSLFRLPRDPKDEPYINLAIHAQVSYLVSRDNDLLDLMDDKAFRQEFAGLTILDPVSFLRLLAAGEENDDPEEMARDR
jgi:putative PIN family toxin of toxin-antitoxin system